MKIGYTSIHRFFTYTTHVKHCVMVRFLPLFEQGEGPGFYFRFESKELYLMLGMGRGDLQLQGTEQMVTEMFSVREDSSEIRRQAKA